MMTTGIDEMNENEKAFGFYAYTLSIISTGFSPQEATERAREQFNPTVVNTIQARLASEPEYKNMLSSTNPVPFYEPLMELLITNPVVLLPLHPMRFS